MFNVVRLPLPPLFVIIIALLLSISHIHGVIQIVLSQTGHWRVCVCNGIIGEIFQILEQQTGIGQYALTHTQHTEIGQM